MIYDYANIDTKVKLGKIFGTRAFLNKKVANNGMDALERMMSIKANRSYTLMEIGRLRRLE